MLMSWTPILMSFFQLRILKCSLGDMCLLSVLMSVVLSMISVVVGWGCDGVGVGGAMCGFCVDICDIDVCCVRLSICVVGEFSVCSSGVIMIVIAYSFQF